MKDWLRNTSTTPRNLTMLYGKCPRIILHNYFPIENNNQCSKSRKQNMANVAHHLQICFLGILLHILWFQTLSTYVASVLQKSFHKCEIVGTAAQNPFWRAEKLTFPGSKEYTVAICGSNNINFNKTNELLCAGLTLMAKLVEIITAILDPGTIKIIQEEMR